LTGRNTLFFDFRLALAGLGLLAAISIEAAEPYSARVSVVSDGDTLWVEPDTGGAPRKLRLQGVDAPEICQSGGLAAREALRVLVMQRRLKVQVNHVDDYGRGLARIEVDGQDVAAALVRQGQAWSYRWRRSLGPYAMQEMQARQAKIGVFAEPNPELPRDFRRRNGSCYAPDSNGGFKLK
jgi:endonuclease YncB( thermonuclease family)